MFVVYSHFVSLAISLTVTVWVARPLQKRGRIFPVDAFHGQQELAWWANLGQAIELVSDKLGLVLVVRGGMPANGIHEYSRIHEYKGDEEAKEETMAWPAGRAHHLLDFVNSWIPELL
jgi:hypothetical protein